MICSVTGPNSKVSFGMRDSFDLIHQRRTPELARAGFDVSVEILDDASDPDRAQWQLQAALTRDPLLVIAPTDSASVRRMLGDERAASVPILASVATATSLSQLGAKHFFRLTTPDRVRAEMLVRYIRTLYPTKTVHVFTLTGAPSSYARQLETDVVHALELLSVPWRKYDFADNGEPAETPRGDDPVLVCAPSAAATHLVTALRSRKLRSQVFTFGSNSNLLQAHMHDTIVVCGLDRDHSNPIVSHALKDFELKFPKNTDPDLCTMHMAQMAYNMLLDHKDLFLGATLPEQRHQFLQLLRTGVHRGLYGQVSFSEDGEMAGQEFLSMLRVDSRRGQTVFAEVRDKQAPRLAGRKWLTNAAITVIGLAASLVGLVQFVDWVQQKLHPPATSGAPAVSVAPAVSEPARAASDRPGTPP